MIDTLAFRYLIWFYTLEQGYPTDVTQIITNGENTYANFVPCGIETFTTLLFPDTNIVTLKAPDGIVIKKVVEVLEK